MVKDIAKDENIPEHFLAKILQLLARKGFLRSTKGPSGGFCLDVPARRFTLLDIVRTLDGLEDYDRCVAGYPKCSDTAPCGMHRDWVRVRSRIMNYLGGSSIGDLARAAAGTARRTSALVSPHRSAKRV